MNTDTHCLDTMERVLKIDTFHLGITINMPDYHYRLELLPTEDGRVYYSGVEGRYPDDAGFDLFVCKNYDAATMVQNDAATLLDLGTAARMIREYPDGHREDSHFWLCPRSSIMKTGMMMANSMGVIDSSYRGTLKAPVWVVAPKPFMSTFQDGGFQGSRYFQIVAPDMAHIAEVVIVDSLPITVRGTEGFGSTGTYTLPPRRAPENLAQPGSIGVVPPPDGVISVPAPTATSSDNVVLSLP